MIIAWNKKYSNIVNIVFSKLHVTRIICYISHDICTRFLCFCHCDSYDCPLPAEIPQEKMSKQLPWIQTNSPLTSLQLRKPQQNCKHILWDILSHSHLCHYSLPIHCMLICHSAKLMIMTKNTGLSALAPDQCNAKQSRPGDVFHTLTNAN